MTEERMQKIQKIADEIKGKINFIGKEGTYFRRQMIQECLNNGDQSIHTPFSLCRDMLSKLETSVKSDGKKLSDMKIAVLFNVEFIECLVWDYGVPPENITFFADSISEMSWAQAAYNLRPYEEGIFEIGGSIYEYDPGRKGKHDSVAYLKKIVKDNNMKFDCVVMNPPYQGKQSKVHYNKRMGKNNSIWDKFVTLAFKLAKEDGYIACIHPPRWRKPKDKLWEILRNKNIYYLSIQSKDDAMKIFNGACDQRFDWYVCSSADKTGITKVRWENGTESEINIKDLPLIPNIISDKIFKMLAKEGEERVTIIHSFSKYFSRPNKSGKGKPWMSSEKTECFQYPCVWSIDYKGNPTLHYSSKREDFFGIPKLIFASGRVSSANYIVDVDGEYGLTQFAKGIVDEPSILPKIYKAMRTDEFKKIMDACSFSTHEIDKDILSLFRKDFWKEFV